MGYEGCTAKLRMERVILEDSFFDETEYLCKIIAYDEEEETRRDEAEQLIDVIPVSVREAKEGIPEIMV